MLISEKLWQDLEPQVPVSNPSPNGSQLWCSDRSVFDGVLFLLMTAISRKDLAQELGFCSGMACWRRLRQWQSEGIRGRLQQAHLHRLRQYDQCDWSRASIDGASVLSPREAG